NVIAQFELYLISRGFHSFSVCVLSHTTGEQDSTVKTQ
ncbi:hypothetical protein AC249_AIPGENE566, partial [Exaiptasia diaphana]